MNTASLKRVAIILASPYPQKSDNHLPGVSQDVVNYQRFLMSSSGGAWKKDEIHIGTHINARVIPRIHKLCNNADIVFLVFSGHGYMRHGDNYININPKQSVLVSCLYTNAKRQITIIDACRTSYPYEHLEGIGDIGMFFDNTAPALGRAMYDHFLRSTPTGRFTMFSASKNQPAQDTENGGLFSYSLLTKAQDWTCSTNKLWLPSHIAFAKAKGELYQNGEDQTPDFDYSGQEIPSMPFTVSPRSYIKKYGLPPTLKRVAYPSRASE